MAWTRTKHRSEHAQNDGHCKSRDGAPATLSVLCCARQHPGPCHLTPRHFCLCLRRMWMLPLTHEMMVMHRRPPGLAVIRSACQKKEQIRASPAA